LVDISIIEFLVYGLVGYTSLVVLIISVIKKEIPDSKPHALARVIWLIPGIIAIGILSGVGEGIILESITTETEVLNGTVLVNATSIQTKEITLLQPFWILFHLAIMLILIMFVIMQVLIIMTKVGESNLD